MSLKIKLAIAFLLVAIAGLIAGALILPWWTGGIATGSFEVDLRHMTLCIEGVCHHPKALSATDPNATPWARMGIATVATSLVAVVLLLVVVFRLVTNKAPGTIGWLASIMAIFTGVLGATFVYAHPDFGDWTPSFGMACTLASSIVAAISILVARLSSSAKAKSS